MFVCVPFLYVFCICIPDLYIYTISLGCLLLTLLKYPCVLEQKDRLSLEGNLKSGFRETEVAFNFLKVTLSVLPSSTVKKKNLCLQSQPSLPYYITINFSHVFTDSVLLFMVI